MDGFWGSFLLDQLENVLELHKLYSYVTVLISEQIPLQFFLLIVFLSHRKFDQQNHRQPFFSWIVLPKRGGVLELNSASL